MLFCYDRAANEDNWLHDCMLEILHDQLMCIDGGMPRSAWPDVIPQQYRPKLRSRSSIRDRLATFLDAYEALAVNDRAAVRGAIADENQLSELFGNVTDCLRKTDLPEGIQGAAEGLFTKLFELLTVLGIRDAQYARIYSSMKARVCPFCGCEYFDPPPLPRHDLDHYLTRTIYPFAASNLNNLAPMGDRCNKSFKKRIDMLRNDAGDRRKCSDPFGGPIASISLLRSVPLQREDGRLPIWRIDLVEDSEELRTWDAVFQIRSRYAKAVLDQEYQGWLGHFGRWSITQSDQDRADIRRLLETYLVQLEPEGISERAFLRRPVFEMLRSRCDDPQVGTELIAQLTDVANVYV